MMLRNITYSLILLAIASSGGHAQIEHGGAPLGSLLRDVPQTVGILSPELEDYHLEDAANDLDKSIPYRFGVNIATDFDSERMGSWSTLPNGDRVWRLGISSSNATSLNLQFDTFQIPEGGRVFVYSPDMKQVKGSFTHENTSPIGSLGVGLIFGESLVIEYQEPAAVSGQGYLHIDVVTYGYRDVLKLPVAENNMKSGPFGNAGQCNININCPEGLPYQEEKRSVAVIVVNNNGLCTGSLINTVLQDGTPYFLTANHCLPNNSNQLNNWVFYFNHESASCDGNNGPTNQSISGASLVANSLESDFALLLLNSAPPESYDVCYAGWNATDNATVTSAVGIHHPRGDVKKICFEDNVPSQQNVNLATLVNQVWYIEQWELGVTEPASSGSPLFNQDGYVIGVLSGGSAACTGTVNNGGFDFFGRLGVAWDFGGDAESRLRDWLDPQNTGLQIVANSCSFVPQDNDLTIQSFTVNESVQCTLDSLELTLDLFNAGLEIAESFTYQVLLNDDILEEGTWTGSVSPGNTFELDLLTFQPDTGINHLQVEILSVNGQPDLNAVGNSAEVYTYAFDEEDLETYTLQINFDDYPIETSWQVATEENVILYSGGQYPDGTESTEFSFCLGSEFCFFFSIFDSADDGLCCQYGQGNYQLLNSAGEVQASGASFGSVAQTFICESLDTQDHRLNSRVFLFPNPASDHTTMVLSSARAKIEKVAIFDLSGRLVSEVFDIVNEISDQRFTIPTSHLAEGLYVVRVKVEGAYQSSKLLISR